MATILLPMLLALLNPSENISFVILENTKAPNDVFLCTFSVQLNLVNGTFGYVYESISLGVGSVLQEMFVDESKEQLTLAMSSDQGSKVMAVNSADLLLSNDFNDSRGALDFLHNGHF